MKKNIFFLLTLIVNCSNSFGQKLINFQRPQEILKIAKQYLPNDPVIVEAGAYDGKDAVYMAQYWPNSTVYTFEPIPYLYKKTILNTKNHKNIKTYQLAVGDSVGTSNMFVSEEPNQPGIPSMSSSLLAPKEHLKHSTTVFPKKITVQTTTFDLWAKENNVNHIDMMWLDMQGYELNALKASPNILSTVKVILTEIEFVEAYKNQALFNEIKVWLEKQGFKIIAINTKWGWFGDGLFVRADLLKE